MKARRNVLRLDPSRTTMLVRAFARELERRFVLLARQVVAYVGAGNGLGLVANYNPNHDPKTGEFDDGSGGNPTPERYGLSSTRDYARVDGGWSLGGKPVQDQAVLDRLNGLAVPPSWTGVYASADPAAKVQAIGYDRKGFLKRRYLASFLERNTVKKFQRVRSFARDIDTARKTFDADMRDGKPPAYLARLEDLTAIRIGSDKDFKAEVKAYGLTTLEGRHVKVEGDSIYLNFVGKEGKQYTNTVRDAKVAGWLQRRKEAAGNRGKLFPDVPAAKLNAYIKGTVGKYTLKDFRTYHATRIAFDTLHPFEGKQLTPKEKKEVVKTALEKASRFLNNTPNMAKKSYIDPTVWRLIGGLAA